MSLKRIPAVGKSLMSRIFAFSSAISIGGYLTGRMPRRARAPKCPKGGTSLTRGAIRVRMSTARPFTAPRFNLRIYLGGWAIKVRVAFYLLAAKGKVLGRGLGCYSRNRCSGCWSTR